MLSHNQVKLIKLLKQKKYRYQHNLFVVEGIKSILEFMSSAYQIQHLFTTDAQFAVTYNGFKISEKELSQISNLKTPNKALALVKIPPPKKVDVSKIIVALDAVSDPGNLGTIIRLCDWFGVDDLICSQHSADCFNEKVVQASMGSLSRVNVSYLDLAHFLKSYPHPIVGTFMDGNTIYNERLPEKAVIIMGNEANGISAEIEDLVTTKISIPQFGTNQPAESLNVATATAIVLNEFRRAAY